MWLTLTGKGIGYARLGASDLAASNEWRIVVTYQATF